MPRADRYPPEMIQAFITASTGTTVVLPAPSRGKAYNWRQSLNRARRALLNDSAARPSDEHLAETARAIRGVFVRVVAPDSDDDHWTVQLSPSYPDISDALHAAGISLATPEAPNADDAYSDFFSPDEEPTS